MSIHIDKFEEEIHFTQHKKMIPLKFSSQNNKDTKLSDNNINNKSKKKKIILNNKNFYFNVLLLKSTNIFIHKKLFLKIIFL